MSGLWMRCAGAALAAAVGSSIAIAQTAPITLSVDLTDAPRKILHATEVMPVTPGALTVVIRSGFRANTAPQARSKTWPDFSSRRMGSQ